MILWILILDQDLKYNNFDKYYYRWFLYYLKTFLLYFVLLSKN